MPPGVRVQPEPRFVHAFDLDSGLEQNYRRDYWNVDRTRFDNWLLELAQRRARFLHGTQFTRAVRTEAGFAVSLRTDSSEQTVTCRYIVGADGATSPVRRRFLASVPAVPHMIAIQVALPPTPVLTTQEVLFAWDLTDYYAWAIPKPDSVLVGAAFSDPHNVKPRFKQILDTLCHRHRLENRVLKFGSRQLSRPAGARHLCPGKEVVLLVSESSGLVSPSSREGISFALRSGMAAGTALGSSHPARAYQRSFDRLARAVAAKFLKAHVIFTPRLRRLALRVPCYP